MLRMTRDLTSTYITLQRMARFDPRRNPRLPARAGVSCVMNHRS